MAQGADRTRHSTHPSPGPRGGWRQEGSQCCCGGWWRYMFDAMDTTGLDTLKTTRTLEAAGFETSQAEALVSVFGGPVAGVSPRRTMCGSSGTR